LTNADHHSYCKQAVAAGDACHLPKAQVCVPLDPRTSDGFDPLAVPTVGSLLNELNAKTASEQTAPMQKVRLWHMKLTPCLTSASAL
jgi:hypothetical protein